MSEPEKRAADFDYTEPETVESLWDTFYQRLCLAVRQRVRNIRRPVASESEVALSAFNSFLRHAQDGRFSELENQEELWRLLKTIAIRKTNDLRKNLRAQKRGGDQLVFNQADLPAPSDAPAAGVDAAAGPLDSPSEELEIAELFSSLLERLPDDRHRDVILLKLQGASVAMIAEHLATTTRTVQRMLKKIEQEWQTDLLNNGL